MTLVNPSELVPGGLDLPLASPADVKLQWHMRVFLPCAAANGVAIVIAVALGIQRGGRADELFQEGRLVTILSAAQIMAMALMSLMMFPLRARRPMQVACSHDGGGRTLWLLMAAGLGALAGDEMFAFHERLDHWLHAALQWQENALTDRVDDLIVLGCGLAGLATLWRFRTELASFRPAWPLLALGFALFFAMVAMDLISNRWSIDERHLPSPKTVEALTAWATVVEESFKLFSEAAFIAAFGGMVALTRRRGSVVAVERSSWDRQ